MPFLFRRALCCSLLCCLLLCFAFSTCIWAQDKKAQDRKALHDAINTDELAAVKAVIKANPKLVNEDDPEETPPLLYSMGDGHNEIAIYLINQGAKVEDESGGETAADLLFTAYNDEWQPLAEALAAKGANFDRIGFKEDTPLLRTILFATGEVRRDKVKWLIAHGVNTERRDRKGRSALDLALATSSAERANGELVQILLQTKAKGVDENSDSPLFAAVASGSSDYVLQLLGQGIDVNAQNSVGDTALHLAVQNPTAMIKLLLDAGARTDLKNNRGDLPIHIALRRDNGVFAPLGRLNPTRKPDGVLSPPEKVLLGTGVPEHISPENMATRSSFIAPLTQKSPPNAKDQFGLSPLLMTLLSRDQESRDLLMQQAPKLDATSQMFDAIAQGDLNTLKTLVAQKPFLPSFRLADGTTPLHVAALWGSLGVARYLVERGADVNARDSRGQTPLHEALVRPVGIYARRSLNMTAFLLDKGADVNALDRNDSSPLHYAARAANAELVALLLGKNAHVNVRDKAGETPLFALLTPDAPLGAVKALLDKGATINLRSWNGAPPLSVAVSLRRPDLVQLFLDRGADMEIRDGEGFTPLALAFFVGKGDDTVPLVAPFIEKGADPNQKLYNGSLLHSAIESRSTALVQTLLSSKKVSLNGTLDYESPLMSAVLYNVPDIARLLIEAGADTSETDEKGRHFAAIAQDRSQEMRDLFKSDPKAR